MKTFSRIFLSILIGIATSISSWAQTNVIDEVVWVVGDEAILRSDVEKIRVDYGNRM